MVRNRARAPNWAGADRLSWNFLFGFANAIALVGWIMLAVLPRGPKSMSIVMYGCVAMLCLVYTALFVLLSGRLVDPGPIAGASGKVSFSSIAGVRALFASDGGIVMGWTHYLAFDLFVGLWIAKDADNKGFSRWTQLPFLIATLLAGPIGLLAWLFTRERRARRAARAG